MNHILDLIELAWKTSPIETEYLIKKIIEENSKRLEIIYYLIDQYETTVYYEYADKELLEINKLEQEASKIEADINKMEKSLCFLRI